MERRRKRRTPDRAGWNRGKRLSSRPSREGRRCRSGPGRAGGRRTARAGQEGGPREAAELRSSLETNVGDERRNEKSSTRRGSEERGCWSSLAGRGSGRTAGIRAREEEEIEASGRGLGAVAAVGRLPATEGGVAGATPEDGSPRRSTGKDGYAIRKNGRVREKFESALVGAHLRTTVVMLAPSRITNSKLRAVTPQTQSAKNKKQKNDAHHPWDFSVLSKSNWRCGTN